MGEGKTRIAIHDGVAYEVPVEPRPERRGRRLKTTKKLVYGGRIVSKGCVEETKRDLWYRSVPGWKLVEFGTFLPQHDFARDDKYLTMSEQMTYFQIECAKRVASGTVVDDLCSVMRPDIKANKRASFFVKVRKEYPRFEHLVEYFRHLLEMERNPGTFSVSEAVDRLVLSVRRSKEGKEMYELTDRLIALAGIGDKVAAELKSRMTDKDFDNKPSIKSLQHFIDKGKGASDGANQEETETQDETEEADSGEEVGSRSGEP